MFERIFKIQVPRAATLHIIFFQSLPEETHAESRSGRLTPVQLRDCDKQGSASTPAELLCSVGVYLCPRFRMRLCAGDLSVETPKTGTTKG